ncbi:MAG: tetraacyldisaccharide 4'-kinase [Pseudomonadota bacterium]
MREPWFWRSDTMSARIIAGAMTPLAAAYDTAQRARIAMIRPKDPGVPVLCIGNATLGGVGKTPCAIALEIALRAEGLSAQFLTRGYGGRLRGPIRVLRENHDALDVGDEALLLAASAPTWVSANRPAGAAAARQDGAQIIIMDDGFQNPTIQKTVSLLLAPPPDNANENLFPAGPNREPLARARERADFLICVGTNEEGAREGASALDADYAAWPEPANTPEPQSVVAFCGIGRPARFFETLDRCGFSLVAKIGYPDHHFYTAETMKTLRRLSADHKAPLITTEKDYARLHPSLREDILTLPIAMHFDKKEHLVQSILAIIAKPEGPSRD